VGGPVVRCYVGDNEQRWFMWYSGRGAGSPDLDALLPASGSVGAPPRNDTVLLQICCRVCLLFVVAAEVRCAAAQRVAAGSPHGLPWSALYVSLLFTSRSYAVFCFAASAENIPRTQIQPDCTSQRHLSTCGRYARRGDLLGRRGVAQRLRGRRRQAGRQRRSGPGARPQRGQLVVARHLPLQRLGRPGPIASARSCAPHTLCPASQVWSRLPDTGH